MYNVIELVGCYQSYIYFITIRYCHIELIVFEVYTYIIYLLYVVVFNTVRKNVRWEDIRRLRPNTQYYYYTQVPRINQSNSLNFEDNL